MPSYISDTVFAATLQKLLGPRFLGRADEDATSLGEAISHWKRLPVTQVRHDRTYIDSVTNLSTVETIPQHHPTTPADISNDIGLTIALQSESQQNIIVVDWYSDQDPENPQNWSSSKKSWVFVTILYSSIAVYMSGSIYSATQTDIATVFNISSSVSSLGLGLFVLGYGVGPMFLSPPSELPFVGRNILYVLSMIIFLAISVPTALATSPETMLVLRFLQGFWGSPVLTTGGASLADVSNEFTRPYALYSLATFALVGPALGITIAGFSTPVLGWRWSLWEILLAAGPALVLLLFLPETSADNILYRRAKRLRTLTGSEIYKSESEIQATKESLVVKFYGSLILPWKLHFRDASVMFTSIYCALVYAIFYSFFEFFPLVYGEIYGFSLGEIGLIFTSVIIAVVLTGAAYCAFIHFVVNRRTQACRPMTPEERLLPALFASVVIPAGLFLFAWTSRLNIHWIVPTIGSMMVSGNVVIIIQSVFVYITMSYPKFAASLFSGNGLARCSVAFAGVLWSQPLYHALGVAWGMTLMACCCLLCIAGIFVLYFHGHVLRARNTFSK